MAKYLRSFNTVEKYNSESSKLPVPSVSLIAEVGEYRYKLYPNYLQFTSLEDSSTISMTSETTPDIKYSFDRKEWIQWDYSTITLNTGDTVYMKGNNSSGFSNSSNSNKFEMTGKISGDGNIMSLLYEDEFEDKKNIPNPGCYLGMFSGCTSLTTAPQLPATTLADNCYDSMFYGCTSLTTAPELPATILAVACYQNMFADCSKLNNIVMLATDISASSCLSSWVSDIASTGTFVKHKDMTSLPSGSNGIPSGWEVKDHITLTECTNLTITADDVVGNDTTTTIHYSAICNGIDYKGNAVTGFVEEGIAISVEFPQNTSETETVEHTITFEFFAATASTVIIQGVWVDFEKQYLTFKIIEDSTFNLTQNACEYSLDEGETWISLTASTNTPTVPAGSNIMFKATNPTIGGYDIGIGTFSSTGKFKVSGNIMSMLYGDDFVDKNDLTGKRYVMSKLFSGCTNIVEAHNLILPATKLASECYRYMFSGCTSLTTAPELPATTLANSCYAEMFSSCTSLTTAPELSATMLATYCYYYMFYNCRSLNNIVMLATDISASNCLTTWVNGVASTGIFVKHKDMTSLPSGSNGIPSGWDVKDYITPTECTNLTITANNVIGNKTATTIHYTAIYNGIDYNGNTVTGIVEEGTAVSAEFPQNTSETETVERTITFEFFGATASTVIIQGVYIPSYEKYLTFETIEDSTFKLTRNTCQYSLDEGETWISLSSNTNTPTVPAGNKIMLKRANPYISSSYGIGTFSSTGKFNVSGNIMSMLYGDDFIDKDDLTGKDYVFMYLFSECTNVVEAHNLILPATTLEFRCYYNMFKGCTSLISAPQLPATTLTNSCYDSMFYNCTSLTTAPELPATTLADHCYSYMFSGCTSLTKAPSILPATTLYTWCCRYMFNGCSSLTTAPQLPATTLAERCYQGMFSLCTSLTTAPQLPATTLAESCYNQMFYGCTLLTTAPELPATALASDCYQQMFYGCTLLTTAPTILPATKLASSCYSSMFYNCTSLTSAPQLPATILSEHCYYRMFYDCTSLTTVPSILPATTLAEECYYAMFYNCRSLTTAPQLPATTLSEGCYYQMFHGCSSLNNIVMLATDISASNCLYYWVNNVAYAGIFTKHPDMTSLPSGASGIPSGWKVENFFTPTECTSLTITADNVIGNDTTTTIHYSAICNGIIDYNGNTVTGIVKEGTAVSAEFPQNTSETETVERTITFEFVGVTASTVIIQGVWVDFEKQYLTFGAIENSRFSLTQNACEYSLDEGETWVSLAANTNTPTVSAGSKIMFKATNPTISSSYGIGTFSSTGKFNVSGNIMSMLYGDDFVDKNDLTGKNYAFCKLFNECIRMVEAYRLALPATTLASYCYREMFYNCNSLTTAPELPATTLERYCYYYMFYNCRSLTTAPQLPATTLTSGCYRYMFYGCTSLNNIVMLATDISASNCLYDWVNNVAYAGTFTKHPDMTSLPSGISGIPSGWTVQDAEI